MWESISGIHLVSPDPSLLPQPVKETGDGAVPEAGTCDWTSPTSSPQAPPANLPGPRPNNSRAADPGSANASTQSNSLSRSVSDTACVPPGTTTPLARPTRGPTRGPTQVSPHPWVDCHQSKLGNSPDESNHACGPMGRRCELMGATWTSYRIRVQSPLLGRECSCWHVGEAS